LAAWDRPLCEPKLSSSGLGNASAWIFLRALPTPPSNRGLAYPSASPHRSLSCVGSTGMLTRFPSATPFGLALGPTNPERIDLPQETLGFRRTRFSRVLSLLVPAGSLPCPPPVLVGRTSSVMECSSTKRIGRTRLESAASVSVLSPGELSAQTQ
jgi:hypothetical protein